MEFVVTALMTHLGLTRDEAIVKMLDIHNTGGMLIAVPSAKEANSRRYFGGRACVRAQLCVGMQARAF